MSTQTNNNSTLIERLFKAGAHFGFKKSRRHPTVAPFLFGTKEGNDIFNLEQTADLLEKAKEAVKQAGLTGKTIMFVGTKDEVVKVVKNAGEKVEMPYVSNRWIGGVLTNFSEIKKRIARLDMLTKERESGEAERKYTKKERLMISREIDNLNFNFKGISNLVKLPDLMIVVDPRYDHIAVKEANDMKIPIIGIMSSDCNIKEVNYPVLVNDSLQDSISLVVDELVKSFTEGKEAYVPKQSTRTETRRS
ncbi:MAG: 30S ribosomal protein S2 [Candidatus Paceibacterota bacterium]